MENNLKPMYRRALKTRRHLLSVADDLPAGDFTAQLYRDAAAELTTFMDYMKRGVRPTPPMPSIAMIAKLDEFDVECEMERFKTGQKAFS
jgi:hypothetical protein